MHRVGARSHSRNERVTGFVVRGVLLFLVGKNHRLALDAHQDLVLGHLKIRHGDELAVLARGPQRRFVHEIRKVRTGKARCAARDDGKLYVITDGHFARMHAQNLFPALHIGARDHHAAVKAAGAKQRRIKNVRPVGCRD